MASITKRENSRGETSYIVQIRIKGAKTISKLFYDPITAQNFADTEERNVRERVKRFHIPDPAKFYRERFSEVIDLYLEEAKPTKKHKSNLAVVKRNIGSVSMAELRTKWVKDYVKKIAAKKTYRGTPYTMATIAVHLSVMASVYSWRAEEYDLDIEKLPFSTRHLDKGWDVERDRRLDSGEEQSLISVMGEMKTAKEWQALFDFAIETAARQQELIFATWSEISGDGLLWTIPAEHTKTRKPRRVPLTDKAITALDSLREGKKITSKSRIFSFLANPSSASSAFAKITKAAAVEDFRFHDLRHEAISRMVLHWHQYSVFEIMKIVGHSSAKMLHRYTNLRGDELVAKMRPNIDTGKGGTMNKGA